MVCPFCLHKKTSVYNSRPTKRINALWRRRRCLKCGKEFTTRETVDVSGVMTVSDDANKKALPFSRTTLLLSISKACDHRTKDDEAYWLCETIEQLLLQKSAATKNIISTEDIKSCCLEVLKNFDTPAFIKYLANHSVGLTDSKSIKKQLRKK